MDHEKKKYLTVVCLIAILAGLAISGAHGAIVDATDPNGLLSVVNPAAAPIAEEVGNYTLAKFSSHPKRLVLNLEQINGYSQGGLGNQLGSVTFTQAVSPLDLVVSFTYPVDAQGVSAPWGRNLASDTNPVWTTSGTQFLAYATKGTAKIVFDQDVYGVGFVVNRLQAPMTVKLWNIVDIQIGSDYTVLANNLNTNHSFFGYYNGQTPEVRSIEFGLGGFSNQFGLDDIVIIYAPRDDCQGIEMAGDVNGDCTVNVQDFALLASHWLEQTQPE